MPDPIIKHLNRIPMERHMKSLPSDPLALQARIMSALIDDIQDRNTKTFPRLNAIRHITERTVSGVEDQ